jgi:hypothetical protein
MPRKPDSLPDWFVGGAGKRRLFRALVDPAAASEQPPWSKAALARVAKVNEKHTVFRHVEVLVQAELLVEGSDGYRVNESSPLLEPIRAMMKGLDRLGLDPLPTSRGKSPTSP